MIKNNLQPGDGKKVVVLVGCGGALAEAFISAYAHKYHIVGIARSAPKSETLLPDFIAGDIVHDYEVLFKTIFEKYGDVAAIVYNAVMYDLTKLIEKKPEHLEKEVATNFTTPLLIANHVITTYWNQKKRTENEPTDRSIITVSSTSGIFFTGPCKQGTYAALKASINILTRHMGAEYAECGVRVNAIAPTSLQYETVADRSANMIDTLLMSQQTGNIWTIEKERTYELLPPPLIR